MQSAQLNQNCCRRASSLKNETGAVGHSALSVVFCCHIKCGTFVTAVTAQNKSRRGCTHTLHNPTQSPLLIIHHHDAQPKGDANPHTKQARPADAQAINSPSQCVPRVWLSPLLIAVPNPKHSHRCCRNLKQWKQPCHLMHKVLNPLAKRMQPLLSTTI